MNNEMVLECDDVTNVDSLQMVWHIVGDGYVFERYEINKSNSFMCDHFQYSANVTGQC